MVFIFVEANESNKTNQRCYNFNDDDDDEDLYNGCVQMLCVVCEKERESRAIQFSEDELSRIFGD